MPDWARGATGSRSVQGCRSRPVPRDGRSSVIVPGGRASAEPLLPRSRLSGGPLAPPSLRPPGPAERVGLGGKSRSGVPPDPLRRDPRGVKKRAKNSPFLPPCGVKSRGSGGAPPTHLILLRNQRTRYRERPPATRTAGPGARGGGGLVCGAGWAARPAASSCCVTGAPTGTGARPEHLIYLAGAKAHLRWPTSGPSAARCLLDACASTRTSCPQDVASGESPRCSQCCRIVPRLVERMQPYAG